MKIGIVSDIHEDVDRLASALGLFAVIGVERIVCLGDVFENGKRLDEAIGLLQSVAAAGVWGNHELGFCVGNPSDVVMRFDVGIRRFFRTFRGSLEIGGFHFSHGMPHWDATDPCDYYTGEPPWNMAAVKKVFARFPHQVFLMGHCHRWYLTNGHGDIPVSGLDPIEFRSGERYLVVVNAVVNGWCAVLDTDANMLTPHSVG
ncbi:MAG: metallophosphoesterase family protein [Planctomycetaceae bacterium]